ncbi:MAG: glucosaminidase domain-containing protein [Prevotellaceae bacterium]|jgi:LysM repeat protein|nr:glucosaminidase domain-containing protein [Prevotellaceae bacterium]
MKYGRFLISLFLLAPLATAAQNTTSAITRAEYIALYKDLAIRQMKESGIPASIILAQGCLESGNGNSRLSVEANNHFGIKCHQSWTGERIYHDDDALQECFRKYPSPEGSFRDHSDFLRYRDRYKSLFDLEPTDYKAWAYGLKKAGYATHPEYAERLIKIIEENQLYLYDTGVDIEIPAPSVIEAPKLAETPHAPNRKRDIITISRDVYERNGVLYVLARTNDTYEKIAIEYDVKLRRILSFNDAAANTTLQKGQVVYIEAKKRKAAKLQPVHIVDKGETLWQISQHYAVKLSSLQKFNYLQNGQEPVEGQALYMRNKMSK